MSPIAVGLYAFAAVLTVLYSIRIVSIAIRHQNRQDINNYTIDAEAGRVAIVLVLAACAHSFL